MLVDPQGQLQELARRKEVAEGLRGILAVLNSNQSLDAILDYTTSCARNLLHADAVAIYRLHPEGQLLSIQSSSGLDEEMLLHSSIPLGQSATGRAVQEGIPVTITNVNEAARSRKLAVSPEVGTLLDILSRYYGAVLSVPLTIKKEKVGALTLYYAQPREFDQEQIDLAVSFCDQAALAIENARLREKTQEEAIAAERNRIARELHDSVTQTIFSASLIAEVLPGVWDRDMQEGKNALEELRQLTRGALAEMRTLLLELRPAGLAEARLEDLLNQLAEGVAGRIRIPVAVQIKGKPDLPPEVKLTFYRIAQEALNNLAKHAAATSVEMKLISVSEETKRGEGKAGTPSRSVTMIIRDDGCGFNPEAVSSEHMGLNIMRERAANAGLSLSIRSKRKKGTEISLAWQGSTEETQQ